MIDGLKVLAVVTARGGSKGIPRKNLAPVGGYPLIWYSIQAAQGSAIIDRTVVSSDDTEILQVAVHCGAEPLRRPAELARDETPGFDPILHALATLPGFDLVVLLQPTSPLRKSTDIDGTIRHCLQTGTPACVTVAPVRQLPHWMYTLDAQTHLLPLMPGKRPSRRQDVPPVYGLNGAVYVARVDWLRKLGTFDYAQSSAYIMPAERSLDIDGPEDLHYLEFLLSNHL